MFELVSPGTHIDFIGRWKIAAVLSAVLIAAGLAAAPTQMQMGIDFAGGWEIQVRFAESVDTDEAAIRNALSETVDDVTVVRFGSDREFLVRFASQPDEDIRPSVIPADAPAANGVVEADGAAENGNAVAEAGSESTAPKPAVPALSQGERADQIRDALNRTVGPATLERVEFVGPRVGAELRRAGVLSLLIAGAMILIYIGFRFSFRFAPGAIVALLHDVSVTSGIWILMGREFNLQVLAALLAIVGYSLNDTIIVYDRIRENMELRTTTDLPEVLNRSINQTLSRTILTSLTTLLAVLSLLIVGGEVIRPFATAMAIGIVIGTYSSVFVAAPVLLWLERRHIAATA